MAILRRRAAALILPIALASASSLSGQTAPACDGRRIRAVRVHPSRLFAMDRPFANIFQDLGNAVSWQTRPETIRRELRFAEGDPCSLARLAESARILRAQPYLRSAEVTAVATPGDSVDVDVETRDELALNGAFRIDTRNGHAIKTLRVIEDNLFGRGILAQVRYDYIGRRAGLVFGVLDRQVLGRNDAELVAGRSSAGPVGGLSLRREFESEYDRIAWRADLRWREEPFVLRSAQFGAVSLPVVSSGGIVGIARRSGPVGRQTVVGIATSVERLFPHGGAIASSPDLDSAANATVAGRYTERRRYATDVFWGYRHVRFVPTSGVDAVNALQDVREGFEVRGILGHGWDAGGSWQRDWSAVLEMYVGGVAAPGTLMFARGRIEGRYLVATHAWDGVIAAGDLYSYTGLSARSTLFLSLEGAGAWRSSTPFQLLVSSPAALRGFGLAAKPAGRRVVAQAEHRYLLGTMFGAADVGSALFVDLGGGWAGDAVFGTNTGLLVAAGAGLRIGFPVGSQVTTRLDVAVPMRGGHGVEVRLTLRRPLGISGPEPEDLERSRLPISQLEPFHFSRY